jgi:hypothetical protein
MRREQRQRRRAEKRGPIVDSAGNVCGEESGPGAHPPGSKPARHENDLGLSVGGTFVDGKLVAHLADFKDSIVGVYSEEKRRADRYRRPSRVRRAARAPRQAPGRSITTEP